MKRYLTALAAASVLGLGACSDTLGPGNASDQDRAEILAILDESGWFTDEFGDDVANASLLDEATAAAEAMSMSRRLCKGKSETYFVSDDCHPQTISVIRTRARSMGFEVVVGDPFEDLEGRDFFGLLLQYPGSGGAVHDLSALVEAAHGKGAQSRKP